MTKPFSPEEAEAAKTNAIPDIVIECFNELIAQNYKNGESIVRQTEVVSLILHRSSLTRDILFEKNYLDVEMLYRNEGWVVAFDSPAYYESYEPYFKFRKKK